MNLMILTKKLLFAFVLAIFSNTLFAQVYVKTGPALNVVVGDTTGTTTGGIIDTTKFTVVASNYNFGLRLNSSVSPTKLNVDFTYGLYNLLNTQGFDLPSPLRGTSRVGLKNEVQCRQGAFNNALFNNISEIRQFPFLTGPDADLTFTNGLVNVFTGNWNKTYGVSNDFFNMSCKEIKGYANHFDQIDPGHLLSLGTDMYGLYNDFVLNSNTKTAGLYNSIVIGANFTGTSYGVYTSINGDSTNGTRYGVYSKVTPIINSSAAKGYAGYFDGNVVVNGTFVNTSDSKLKENIVDLSGGIETIKKLSPKKYDLISERGGDGQTKHYGLIAQDVETILPELVKTVRSPGDNTITRTNTIVPDVETTIDANGKSITRTKNRIVTQSTITEGNPVFLKTVNYNEIISILLQAVKEQQAVIEQLQKDVEVLKKK